ncbi:MAG: GNAT family protein [Pseudomonadota bacterium]
MTEIRTQRLRLVALDFSHVKAMHSMSVDPEVRRYLFDGKVIDVAEVEQMVIRSQQTFVERGTGLFVMFVDLPDDKHHGQFVGFCGHRVFEDSQQMELLFGMEPRFWGRGFGQEAARRILEHGFESCNLISVLAATDTPNQRSVQVLQRLGMSFKERREFHGLDTVFYEISAEEFLTLEAS